MLRLTEWSWIGIVMISITSSTSITSISGVVLMSIITSGCLPGLPTLIAIAFFLCCIGHASAAPRGWLGDESDLRDPGPLACVDDPTDARVLRAAVTADLHLGLRHQHGDLLQPVDQGVGVCDQKIVPVNVAGLVHGQNDVLRLCLADLVLFLRQLDRD